MFETKRKAKKLFRFGRKVKAMAKPAFRSVRAKKIKDVKDEGPWYIRGIKAGSKEEYWCSIVLAEIEEETGWSWEFQVPVYGGRTRAGGNVVDFLIHTPGMWTILDPMGRYWHSGHNEDRYQMERVARKKKWRLIAWYTDQTPTLEIMRSFLRNELGV
jgi:hypothetical protein